MLTYFRNRFMIKKAFSLLLILYIVLALVGCKPEPIIPGPSNNKPTEEDLLNMKNSFIAYEAMKEAAIQKKEDSSYFSFKELSDHQRKFTAKGMKVSDVLDVLPEGISQDLAINGTYWVTLDSESGIQREKYNLIVYDGQRLDTLQMILDIQEDGKINVLSFMFNNVEFDMTELPSILPSEPSDPSAAREPTEEELTDMSNAMWAFEAMREASYKLVDGIPVDNYSREKISEYEYLFTADNMLATDGLEYVDHVSPTLKVSGTYKVVLDFERGVERNTFDLVAVDGEKVDTLKLLYVDSNYSYLEYFIWNGKYYLMDKHIFDYQ